MFYPRQEGAKGRRSLHGGRRSDARLQSHYASVLALLVLVCAHAQATMPAKQPIMKTASHHSIVQALQLSTFNCDAFQHPGYFVDMTTDCRGFHVCQSDGRHDVFVCPNGTVFNQRHLICDWADSIRCEDSEQYYNVNVEAFSSGAFHEPEIARELLQPHLQPHLVNAPDMLQVPAAKFVSDSQTSKISTPSTLDDIVIGLFGSDDFSEFVEKGPSVLFSSINHHPSW